MKKSAIVFGLILLTQFAISQNKFRFGLKLTPSVNWLKPDNVQKFTSGGSTIGFNWGLTGEYMISDNFSFYSGLELNHEKGKISFKTNTYYNMKENYELTLPEDTSAYSIKLNERAYKSTYVTLPIGIKMKTNEIGYMTYFGEFGLNLAFRTGTKITDKAELDDPRATISDASKYNNLEGVNYDKDMQPIRVQLRVGLGGEYRVSGGTSLFVGLHYNLGFTNIVKGDSKYLISPNTAGDNKPVSQKFKAHGVQLTVGVLF